MVGSQSSPALRTRGVLLLALAASSFWFWSIYVWYQGIYTELEITHAERNAAVAAGHSQEAEKQALMEQNTRMMEETGNLEVHFAKEMALVQKQMEDLNTTIQTAGQALGYANFPGGQVPSVNNLSMDDIVVIIKTGATEAYKVLPIHLATTLTHTPNVLLFSDHNQTIGPYHIQDALDEVAPSILRNNGDWQLYKDQKQYMSLGQSPESLQLRGGWELDKYKNLHMLAKTYRQRPTAKWYLYLDADSYVLTHNLLLYLSSLNPARKLYLGSASYINNLAFGHGGTGYVISAATMHHIMTTAPDIARDYDDYARKSCCGDYVLAQAFKDHGIELSWIHPTFQGDPQYKLEMDKGRYCKPIVTLHHMLPQDIGRVWEYERRVATGGKWILYQDFFETFMFPHMRDERWDWDCMSGDRGEIRELPEETWRDKEVERFDEKRNLTVKTYTPLSKMEVKKRTFEACRKVCREKYDCIMFRTWRRECKIDWHLALGYKVPVSRDDNEDHRSGWMMDRVEEMREGGKTCPQPEEGWVQRQVKWS